MSAPFCLDRETFDAALCVSTSLSGKECGVEIEKKQRFVATARGFIGQEHNPVETLESAIRCQHFSCRNRNVTESALELCLTMVITCPLLRLQ